MIRKVKWSKNFLTRIQGQGKPFITWGSGGAGLTYENPIPAENALTPSLSADWDLRSTVTSGANAGFSRQTSYNAGETAIFAVDTTGATVASTEIRIYRIGHYNGTDHGRLVATLTNTPVAQTATVGISGGTPLVGDESKAVDCTGWTDTATWDIPADAVSGLYCALIEGTPRQQIIFVVREDSRVADIVCIGHHSHTHNAYNTYGGPGAAWNAGRSLYHEGLGGWASGRSTRAFVASRHRPNTNRGTYVNDPTRFDYCSVDFLEEQGYNVKYISDEDLSRGTGWLTNSKVLYIQGHNEYWTDGMINNVQVLRNIGVHVFIAAGNIHYWRVRDDVANPHQMWCYKDTHEDTEAGYDPDTGSTESMDPVAPNWTGTWYDTRANSLSGGNYTPRLPQDTVNTFFRMDAVSSPYYDFTVVGATYQNVPMWRDTPIESGTDKTFVGIVGFEYDEHVQPADSRPWVWAAEGSRALTGTYYDDNGHATGNGTITTGFSLSRTNVDAGVVFNTGGMNWVWSLSSYHTGSAFAVDADARQATVNLLEDMGATAATLDVGLTQPVSVDLNTYGFDYTPIAEAGGPYAEASGVAVVFSSLGSVSWDGSLTYSWDFGDGSDPSTLPNPTHTYADGSYTATLTVTDGSSRTAQDTASVDVGVVADVQPFFSGDETWGSQGTNTQGYVQGSFFTPTVNGSVTEIHMYETADMGSGSLAVNVYTVSPQPPYSDLDVITCTPIGSSENLTLTGAAGWRTLTLATPVAVTAGTTYVVGCAPTAYFSNNAYVQEIATPPTVSGYGTIWGAVGTTVRASGLDRVRTTRYYPTDITFVAD